ncbi:hypothetical protein VTN49DRAFT_875 [Thermomyces lanuginosus]|uniref:uncharacterized protein n=1 Tax=Thermomyces lanuginosus TaxID=5541 RepID=UPI00374355DC
MRRAAVNVVESRAGRLDLPALEVDPQPLVSSIALPPTLIDLNSTQTPDPSRRLRSPAFPPGKTSHTRWLPSVACVRIRVGELNP